MKTQDKRLLFILCSVPLLLAIPFLAMQFSSEVMWSLTDFIIMGILLLSVGLGIEFILRKIKHPQYRIAFIIGAILLFLLIWAELAVGVFGTPFAGS